METGESRATSDDGFEQLLDLVLKNPLWDTALVAILTALSEEIEAGKQGGAAASREVYSTMAYRLTHVVERLGQRLLLLVQSRRGQAQPPGPPGADQYLNWMATSLQEAQANLHEAWQHVQAGDRTERPAQLLSSGVYFAATLTGLLATFDKFMPRGDGGSRHAAGN